MITTAAKATMIMMPIAMTVQTMNQAAIATMTTTGTAATTTTTTKQQQQQRSGTLILPDDLPWRVVRIESVAGTLLALAG